MLTAATSILGLSRAQPVGVVSFGVTTIEPLGELVGLPRGVPRSQPLGTRRFQKQKLLGVEFSNFLLPGFGATKPGTRSRYKCTRMVPILFLACRPGGLTDKKLNLASLSRPSAFTSTSCPPSAAQRLHFPPRSSRITIAQAASETRGMSRKVVRSSRSMFICVARGGAGGTGRHADPRYIRGIQPSHPTSFRILDWFEPARPLSQAVQVSPFSHHPSPEQSCSTSPQRG